MMDIMAWCATAKRGERVEYCRGELAFMRELNREARAKEKPEPHGCWVTAAADAWQLYLGGKVTLVQRRLGPHLFAYEAVRL